MVVRWFLALLSIGSAFAQFQLTANLSCGVWSPATCTRAAESYFLGGMQALNGSQNYDYTVVAGAFPQGVRFLRLGNEPFGYIVGTPPTPGTYQFTIQAAD